MNKIIRYELLFFTKDTPLAHNVFWLEKCLGEDSTNETAFNLYFHNNGEWRNILQQMWVNREDIKELKEKVDAIDLSLYATKLWVENKHYLTLHQSLEGYAKINDDFESTTETWSSSKIVNEIGATAEDVKDWVYDEGFIKNIKINGALGTVNNHIAELTIEVPGGGEPNEYLKSVTIGNNTCTFTKKDNSTEVFTVDLSDYALSTDLNDYLPLAGGVMSAGAIIDFNEGGQIKVADDVFTFTSAGAGDILIEGLDKVTIGCTQLNSALELDVESVLPANSGTTELGSNSKSFKNGYFSSKVYAAEGFFQTSDIRKKDIKSELSLDKAYSLIEKCSSVIYTLKGEDSKQLGLIALEVEEFFPEIISTDSEGYKSLDYSRLTVVILRALKDLLIRVQKLEEKK